MPVIGAVAKTPRRSATARSSRKQSWLPTMNALPCAGFAASSAFAAKPWSPGLKKVATLPKLRKTLVKAEKGDVLELDEMWSYVFARKNKRWIWLAQCRRTRQSADAPVRSLRMPWGTAARRPAPFCGIGCRRTTRARRSTATSGRLIRRCCLMRSTKRRAKVQARRVISPQYSLERFNNIIRQRLRRFVRKTLSFSKCDEMHEMSLRLFLHEHNMNCQH